MQQVEFNKNNKIKSSSENALKHADAHASIIAFTNGTTESGRPYYAYIAVKPSKYREFCERTEAREAIRLTDYGKLVVYGYESTPPAEVKQHMRKKFGFDDEYEKRLRQELHRQREKHSIDKEEQRLMDIVAMMKSKKKP
ncbi:MAG: hypothetical protein AB7L92_00100 [Alphaproteobacteria bacterium]